MHDYGFNETIRWYDRNAVDYADKLYSTIPSKSIEMFLDALPANPHIFEAGCGPGRESKFFLDNGAKVVGVDVSKNMLEIAKKKNSEATYIHMDFRQLSFENEQFDGVWAHASLLHLETDFDVKRSFSEFYRVLKSNGVLFIGLKKKIGSDKSAVVSDSLSGTGKRFFRYYTEESLCDLLNKTNFEPQKIILSPDAHNRSSVEWVRILARKNE